MSDVFFSFQRKTFVALDLETTGLDPRRHRIIEVAAIKFTLGEVDHLGEVNHLGKNCLVKIDGKVPRLSRT